MKVTISVGGRFHAFNLAYYLQEAGVLHRLVTSYPRFFVRRFGIKKQLVSSIVVKELLMRGAKALFRRYPSSHLTSNLFDWLASFVVPKNSDVYIIFSSYCLYTARKIRKLNPNAIIILERSSAHILEQERLLCEATGSKSAINRASIRKQLEEYEECDFIMTCSSFIRQSFISYGVLPEKLLLNHLGVDVKEFYPLKKTGETFTVGYVGVMSHQKNVWPLFQAIRNLNERGCKLTLLLVGAIEHGFEPMKEILTANFVVYQAAVPQKELVHYYSLMDVFVLNSIQDGFGMVTLQAMACGLPVIVSENAGSSELIEEGVHGFVISPYMQDKLEQTIQWCYEHPGRMEVMATTNRETVVDKYSWEQYGLNYLRTIKKVVEQRCLTA